MKKQTELIKQLSNEELKRQLIFSQSILIVLGVLLSLFLFESMTEWFSYFTLDLSEIAYYGVLSGVIIVSIDLLLMFIFPKKYYDDGGLNERIFQDRSISEIFGLTLFIAISEELLFRGVIQTTFGYVVASVVFALIHIRYLKKPVLLISVLLISFYIGYLFLLTENLFVTITSHFVVDFTLGVVIRFQRWGGIHE